jgi:hypothetical protein
MDEQKVYKLTILAPKLSHYKGCIHNYADLTKDLEIMALQILEIIIKVNQMTKKLQESSTKSWTIQTVEAMIL